MSPKQLRLAWFARYEIKKLEADEYVIKYKQQIELAVINAWLTENYRRTKDLKTLNHELARLKPKKQMDEDELLNQGMRLTRMYGGEIDAEE